jgi:hypothetical protein
MDRDATRAAKARRRAQRLALRAKTRPGHGTAVLNHVPVQKDRQDDASKPEEAEESGSLPPLGTWGAPELPEHFITADDLAEHSTEAERLQADLAGVRQMLDQPLPPVRPRPQRRLIGPAFWLGVVMVIFLAGAVIAVLVVTGHNPFGGQNPASAPSSLASVPADSTATGTAASTIGGQVAGLPTSGPGIDAPGAALGIQVLADQSIAVTEQANLPGLASFDLSMPGSTPLTGDAQNLKPVIKDLSITINGSRASATQTGEGDWTVVSPAGGAQRVLLTYRLVDAVAVSQPSSQGRALALVTPLLAQLLHNGNQPVDLRIPADGVSNVVCPGAPQAESLCGAHIGTNWQVTIPDDAESAAVLLQLDLR